MITQFHVANYKALRDVTLDLTPLHVLIGPNGSGKSSILEAVTLLSRGTTHPFGSFWPNVQDAATVPTSPERPITLSCRVDDPVHPVEYGVAFEIPRVDTGPQVKITDEYFSAPPGGEETKISAAHSTWTALSQITGGTAVQGLPRGTADIIAGALTTTGIQRWNPQFLRMPVALSRDHKFQISPSGFGLAQCLDDLLGDDREQFAKLEQDLRGFFPEIQNIQLRAESPWRWPNHNEKSDMPIVAPGTSGKGISFKLAGGKSIPAVQASDGVMVILGYLTLLRLPAPPQILLIEEPENGIHPQRVAEIIKLLRKLVTDHTKTQIIMTTHSPYLLDEFRPEEVTLCSKASDGIVSVRRLSDIPTVHHQLDVFRLGEIWTAEGDEQLAKSPVEGTK